MCVIYIYTRVCFYVVCAIYTCVYLSMCVYLFVSAYAGRDWGQEEKGTTEDEMAGWHH